MAAKAPDKQYLLFSTRLEQILDYNYPLFNNAIGVIKAAIGHSKSSCLACNGLLGAEGDKTNVILCGCGYNICKLLRAFIFGFGEFCFWDVPIARES